MVSLSILFCNVPFYKQDGAVVNTRRQQKNEHGMSNFFLRYEHLRWAFMDECQSLGCEVLATGEDTISLNTRDEHTWALRESGEKRP